MQLNPFKLERYLANYEFSAPYLLCCSDCQPLGRKELLDMADEESLELWENLSLGYTDCLGHPLLREEIARLYDPLTLEDVLVLCPEEGIFIAMNALLKAGDHVIVTFPGYQSLYEIARSRGCEVTRWLPGEQEEGWRFDVDFLEGAVRANTRLIVVNFPHNPTGALPSKDDFQRIVEIARAKDIYLFSDEMYRFLEYDETDRLDPPCTIYDKAISLCGMSKSFALAGLRLGWLATRDKELLERCLLLKDYTTICSSAPSEILGLMALRAGDRIVSRNREIIGNNLALLEDFFSRHPGLFTWRQPAAGPITLVRTAIAGGAEKFCDDLVTQKGVLLLPSRVYDYGDGHFRIGFGRSNLTQALPLLEEYLEGLG